MKRNPLPLLAFLLLFAAGCKKDKTETVKTPSPMEGFWQGKYNNNIAPAALYTDNYAILFKSNGLARVYDMGTATDTASITAIQKVTGTWVPNGTTLQVSYPSDTKIVNTTATVNAAFTSMIGVWSHNTTVKGNFYLNK